MITFTGLEAKHLQEEDLHTLNGVLKDLFDEVDRLSGGLGNIELTADIDMKGHLIHNVGEAKVDTDALTRVAADKVYSSEVMRRGFEALGNRLLSTARRLNDQTQREQSSTFLNDTLSMPPNSNNSAVTVVSLGGGQSQITVAAGTFGFADSSTVKYAQRQDTVTDPGAGSNFYYYYLRVSDYTLQVIGPFTSDTSFNQLGANYDGNQFVAVAQVNFGGGGAGGGGGDTRGSGGCCDVARTQYQFPAGSSPSMQVVPCEDWVQVKTDTGRTLMVHPSTLVSVFIEAEVLQNWMLIEVEEGGWERLDSITRHSHKGYKGIVRVPKVGTYLANGIRVHNAKTS